MQRKFPLDVRLISKRRYEMPRFFLFGLWNVAIASSSINYRLWLISLSMYYYYYYVYPISFLAFYELQ